MDNATRGMSIVHCLSMSLGEMAIGFSTSKQPVNSIEMTGPLAEKPMRILGQEASAPSCLFRFIQKKTPVTIRVSLHFKRNIHHRISHRVSESCTDLEAEVAALFADTHDLKVAIRQQNQQTAGSNEQVGQFLWRFHTPLYGTVECRFLWAVANCSCFLTPFGNAE